MKEEKKNQLNSFFFSQGQKTCVWNGVLQVFTFFFNTRLFNFISEN
jgi:hypothetical protein